MIDTLQLSKVLRAAMKSGKFTVGARESVSAVKGAKAVVCTQSIPASLAAKIRDEAKKHNVALIEVPVSSAELARMIGRPYKVSALALRSINEADLKAILR
jgi:ribosomal protein L30E